MNLLLHLLSNIHELLNVDPGRFKLCIQNTSDRNVSRQSSPVDELLYHSKVIILNILKHLLEEKDALRCKDLSTMFRHASFQLGLLWCQFFGSSSPTFNKNLSSGSHSSRLMYEQIN